MRRVKTVFKKFLHSTSGNFAIIAAVAMIPVVVGIGVAIDYGRGVNTKADMQNSLDGAVLAALNLPDTATKEQRQKKLQAFYAANGGLGTAQLPADLVSGATSASLKASAKYEMPTSIMGIVGVDKVNVTVESAAQKPVKLTTLSFKVDGVAGAWDKTVYLMARPKGATKYDAVLRMEYIYPWAAAPGGNTTVSKKVGSNWVDTFEMKCETGTCTNNILSGDGTASADLVNMDDVYPQMDVTAVAGIEHWFYKEKSRTLKSNDPATANQMFTEGVAAKLGDTVNIVDVVGCGEKWIEQRWEDGGGYEGAVDAWEGTDFKYQVKGACSADGSIPRLTQ